MRCRHCKNEIPAGSIYCNLCGERQIKARKKPGEISVPKARQLPSGSWFIQLRAEGESITEETEQLCIARAKAIRAGFIKTHQKTVTITVGEAVDRYIKSRDGIIAPSTIADYKKTRKNHMQDIMQVSLSELTQDQFQDEIAKLAEKKAPKTVKNIVGLIYPALRKADKTIDFDLTLPAKVKFDYSIPDAVDIPKILNGSRGTPIEVPVVLALALGLRMSEIRALTPDCIDADDNTLHIKSAIVTVDGKPLEKDAKTYTSKRKIIISESIKNLLVNATLPIPLSDKAIYNRFVRMCKKQGIKKHYRFHDLRHAQASVGLALRIPNKYMQERLGHSTDEILKSVYQHTFSPETKEFSKAINDYFDDKITNEIANVNGSDCSATDLELSS